MKFFERSDHPDQSKKTSQFGRLFRRVLVGLASLLLLGSMILNPVLVKPTYAAGDILAYAKLSDGSLGIFNLSTGTFSPFPSGPSLVGLGEIGSTLYADTVNSGTLYTVNPQDGTLTVVGSANINFQAFGSTTNGLFALDYGMNLYSIDPATGAAHLLGSTGLNNPDHNGLSSGSSTLYYTDQFGTATPTVHTLNTTTGAATRIGNTPGVFGPIVIGGMLYVESWIPCTANPSGICAQSIYSFDPTTGNSAFVSNVSTASQTITDGLAPVIDTTPPSITITSPTATIYLLNQSVLASYSCSDSDSAVATCIGPVPNGSPLDTSSVGTKTFTVQSSDPSGNTASQSVNYTVSYNLCVLYDQTEAVHSGATIPIKLELCDSAGTDVSSSTITVTAVSVTQVSTNAPGTLISSGNANPDNNFRFDSTLGTAGGYIFNLKTNGLATGTYALSFTAGSDPTIHTVEFEVK